MLLHIVNLVQTTGVGVKHYNIVITKCALNILNSVYIYENESKGQRLLKKKKNEGSYI